MCIVETLLAAHPVRKTGRQKDAFRAWVVQRAEQIGYAAQVEENGRNRNVVIGAPETAQVTVCEQANLDFIADGLVQFVRML